MSFKLVDFHAIVVDFESYVNSTAGRIIDNLMEIDSSLQLDDDGLVCFVDNNKAKNTVKKQ